MDPSRDVHHDARARSERNARALGTGRELNVNRRPITQWPFAKAARRIAPLCCVLLLVACDEGSPSDSNPAMPGDRDGTASARHEPPPSQRDSRKPGRSSRSRPTDAPVVDAPGQASRAGDRGPGSRIITTASGVVLSTPPKPGSTLTRPSSRCAQVLVSRTGKDRRLRAPPIPGIQARRLDARAVELKWRFESNPSACRAVRLSVTVDVSDDVGAGNRVFLRVRGSDGTHEVTLPPDLRRADVLKASAIDARGLQSPPAAVTIR
jgi:hypothetical protein